MCLSWLVITMGKFWLRRLIGCHGWRKSSKNLMEYWCISISNSAAKSLVKLVATKLWRVSLLRRHCWKTRRKMRYNISPQHHHKFCHLMGLMKIARCISSITLENFANTAQRIMWHQIQLRRKENEVLDNKKTVFFKTTNLLKNNFNWIKLIKNFVQNNKI